MKVNTVTYARLVNTGNYEHERIELSIDLEEGETPSEAVNRARAFIDAKCAKGKIEQWQFENASKVVADPMNHTGQQVNDAYELITKYIKQNAEDLPF